MEKKKRTKRPVLPSGLLKNKLDGDEGWVGDPGQHFILLTVIDRHLQMFGEAEFGLVSLGLPAR